MGKVNLLDYRKEVYSSIGNDGIIDFIFDKIGIDKSTFVEFGAWDGVKNSNCRNLFEKGWKGIFIESDKDKYKNLKNNYKDSDRVKYINRSINLKGENLFDNIVGPYIEENIDFCSIDIDGLDLEVFETFEKCLPIVVCIEGGQMLSPYNKRVKKNISKKNIQQSLWVMVNSFEQKGYKVLCSYQDTFFVKKEFYNLFDVSNNILTLYFNGLRSIPRRMPFIQKYVNKVGLKNEIVDYILKKSNYRGYGWDKRKIWVREQSDYINELINEKEKIEKRKYEKN